MARVRPPLSPGELRLLLGRVGWIGEPPPSLEACTPLTVQMQEACAPGGPRPAGSGGIR
jgi:hypothetical protein